jgi:hypothetical protein
MAQPPHCQPQSRLMALDRRNSPPHNGPMEKVIAETLADGRWLPFRFVAASDEIQFAWAPPELQQSVSFLSELQPSGDQLRVLPRSALARLPVAEAPLHFILHPGLGGSTLLAQVLTQPGMVRTLKEPPILTDLVAFALNVAQAEAQKLCDLVAALLARPIERSESIVIKMSSVGNGLVLPMAVTRPGSRVLCLRGSLDGMLASLARRGLEGRISGRKLFIGLRNARLGELGFSGKDLFEQTDLQLAALAWVAIQRLIVNTAEQLGAERVRSISTEALLERPRESVEAISEHFGIDLDVDERLASGIFERHAKTGETFDIKARQRATAEAMAIHGDEIRPIVEWARKVAQAQLIAWDLPHPLLD